MDDFEYVFPAIRGRPGAARVLRHVCPLRLIPRLFLFDEEELPAEMRAQRVLEQGPGARDRALHRRRTATATSSRR